MLPSLGISCVLPMTDVTTMLLVQSLDALKPAVIAAPSALSYEAVTDKAALVQKALTLRIPVPRTLVMRTRSELAQHLMACEYPIVLKPARSRYQAGTGIRSTSVIIARDREAALRAMEAADWLDHVPCLVQEFIAGHGAGIFALGDGKDVLAWFAHRRLREKPPSGGVSVLSESAPIDERMREYAGSLLRAVNWLGPAMVEFRVAVDGTPYLMEVNGRFWGSLQLAIDAGVDFPSLFLDHVLSGTSSVSSGDYKIGQRLRWLLGDVDNLLLQMRGPASTKYKLNACRDFVRTFLDVSCKQEILRWSDPKPAIVEFRNWLRALA